MHIPSKIFSAAALLGIAMTLFSRPAVAETVDFDLSGKRVAFLLAEGFQDAEALAPIAYLHARGAEITIVGLRRGMVKAYNNEHTLPVRKTMEEVTPDGFDGVVIPGGHAPRELRASEAILDFVRAIHAQGKVVAGICHGPQVMVSAGIMEGRRATCFAGMRGELQEAGADYLDQALVRDGNLITSRLPGDLPEFNRAIAEALVEKK